MFRITGNKYSYNDFKPFFKKRQKVTISPEIQRSITQSYNQFSQILKSGVIIYGVNTGFGKLSNVRIDDSDLKQLQLNLVRSHCAGIGKPFGYGLTRVILLLKLINFSFGHSGVRLHIVRQLQQFLNRDILPIIPSRGSVGASGDLAPLAHMTLSLIGEGDVHFCDRILPSIVALKEAGIEPVTLHPKEGLSLINGTQVSTALAVHGLIRSHRLLITADIIGAMSVEASLCSRRVFREEIHILKKHPGQRQSALNVWRMLEESEIVASHMNCEEVQDPYSFRCIPQVHGASREIFTSIERIINNEINSVSDNPVILHDSLELASSGHFHAEIVGQAVDSLAIAMAEIGAISERRIARFMKGVNKKIPQFLTSNPGLESGFMMAHVTAAALASEIKTYTFPASVDSISTSAGQEDFVSMAPWAGRKLLKILNNVENILAIELLVCTQALDLLHPLTPGKGTSIVRDIVRKQIKLSKFDKVLSHDIESAVQLIRSEVILNVMESKYNIQ